MIKAYLDNGSRTRPPRSVLCLPLAVFSALGLAAEFTVLGPENVIQQNREPVTQTLSFSLRSPNTAYSLRVANGGLSGEYHKVTGATVWLNGRRILGQGQISPSLENIAVAVSPETYNILRVKLDSQPGSGVTLQLTGTDNDPPVLVAYVTPPANAQGWHHRDVTIRFECHDATSGVAVCPDPVHITAEGAGQVITATAFDQAGNAATASVTINLGKPALSHR